jgi:hypothetical protein
MVSRVAVVLACLWVAAAPAVQNAAAFDHAYASYARLLARVVNGARVDYRSLAAARGELEAVASVFDAADTHNLPQWSRPEQMAFWINAYNVFTLRAIVEHYPIRAGWFSLGPRNSIRQIDGVWTELTWRAAGRTLTLDDIEHTILRPTFNDPRVHFAINCASVGCPPLAREPYIAAAGLDQQLDASARRYLASPQGLQVTGNRIKVSSIFKWYGADFGTPPAAGVLAFVTRFGPASAAALASSGKASLEFLDYDWSLNDTASLPQQSSQ